MSVELAALVVEAVREFVADHHADCAIVYGIIHGLLEERWLQNAGRKVDRIQLWIVVRVDGRRRHGPLTAVYGLADLSNPALKFERRSVLFVDEIAFARDLHAGIIAPVRRIADFVFDSFQLHDGLFLGGGRHPGRAFNVIMHSALDGMHHFNGARPALRRKSTVHISLAQSFTEIAVGCVGAAPPARQVLFLACQRVRKEVKIFVDHRFG